MKRFWLSLVAGTNVWVFGYFAVLSLGSTSNAGPAPPRLSISPAANRSIRLIWPSPAPGFVLEQSDVLDFAAQWQAVAQTPIQSGNQFSVTLDTSAGIKFFRLHAPLVTIAQSSPANGETGVAVLRETIVHFSGPLSLNSVLATNNFYAGFGGRRLLSRVELASDRTKATLFYLEPMPGSTRIAAVFDGTGLTDERGRPIDPDGDGVAGGSTVITFDTLNLTALAGTAVIGTVYASEFVPGSDTGTNAVNKPLAGVTITVDGREEDLRAVTDSTGNFTLSPAPPGRFFVHIDGRTAVDAMAGIHYPDMSYYPYVGKAWDALAGLTDNLAGGTGKIYLPLIVQGTLQPVSMTSDTRISFPPSVVSSNPALAGVSITVPANSLFSDDGTRGGKVGIAPVPPDRLPGPLPPGLELPLVITVQTDGGLNFDKPAPICFPNLPDPILGTALPAGSRQALISFNHKKGIWEAVGDMTVSADGRMICTDPGSGIVQPGWHGVGPPPDGPNPPCGECRCPAPNGGPSPTSFVSSMDQVDRSDFENGQLAAHVGLMGPAKKKRPPKSPKPPPGWGPAPCPNPLPPPPPPPTCSDNDHAACLEDCNDKAKVCEEDAHKKFGNEFQKCIRNNGKVDQQCVNGASYRYGLKVAKCYTSYAGCVRGCIPACTPATQVAAQTRALTPQSIAGRRRASIAQTNEPGASAADALAAEITQLMDQIVTVVTPFVDAATWPANVEATVEQLAAQLDTISNGKYPELLAQYVRRIEDARFFNLFDTYYSYDNSPSYPVVYVAEIKRANGQQLLLRGETQAFGQYSLFIPRDGQLISVRFYDKLTKSYAIIEPDPDAGPGSPLPYFTLFYLSGDEVDSDDDGLPDVVELVYGTDPNNPDSDGDGIPDGAEIDQGTNPLDGRPAQTGIIATAKTPGPAVDICAVNNLAILAEGTNGVSVFNVFAGQNPTLVTQVDTPGFAQRVACGGDFVAVADGSAGLAVLDISNPAATRVAWQVSLGANAQSVAVAGNLAYVGLDTGYIATVDMLTGTVLDRVSVGGGAAVQDLALGGDFLYALTVDRLISLSLLNGLLSVAGSASSPYVAAPNARLFVGGDITYAVHNKGYNTLSLTNPAQPALIAAANTAQFGWKQIVPNGSGLGVAAVSPILAFENPATHNVSLYDLKDPTKTDVFLTEFPTPGFARAVSIFNGLAYVADDFAGLQVINYLAYDAKGVPPAIMLTTSFSTNGVEEGKPVRLTANVTDDVQVRNVEFYIDGVKVVTDGNFPFEHRFAAPLIAPGRTSFRVRALATDTGGNFTWSDELVVPLLPDRTPPTILRMVPGDGAVFLTNSIVHFSARMSEAINAATWNATSVQVFSAGADGLAGTSDDVPVTGAALSYRDDLSTAFLDFNPPTPAGSYRVVVSAPLADLAGNTLAAPIVWTFRIVNTFTITYSRAGSPEDTIWLAGGDGSFEQQVTTGEHPRLSPDGKYLLFLRGGGSGNYALGGSMFVRDLQTTNETRLFNNSSDYVVYFDWQPDNTRIVFDYSCSIYTINRDGIPNSATGFIQQSDCYDDAPAINQVDGRVAFHNQSGLRLVDANGGGQVSIPNTSPGDYWAAWSPDGQWLSFLRSTTTNYFKIRPDGSGLTQLTALNLSNGDGLSGESPAVWTPDSQAVVTPAKINGIQGIYIFPANGAGSFKQVPTAPGADVLCVGSVSVVAPLPAGP